MQISKNNFIGYAMCASGTLSIYSINDNRPTAHCAC